MKNNNVYIHDNFVFYYYDKDIRYGQASHNKCFLCCPLERLPTEGKHQEDNLIQKILIGFTNNHFEDGGRIALWFGS